MTTGTQAETLSSGETSITIFRDAPLWVGKRTAALGSFKFGSAATGAELLGRAIAMLKAESFEALIGPMDGDTWHSYRAVTESDGSPAFLMEPVSGPHDVAVLEAAGFSPIGGYVSMRVATKDAIGERPDNPSGLRIVNWDGRVPAEFFGEVFDFSVEEFARNTFYKPIARKAFLDLYMSYVPLMKRELIFFARTQDGELAGFLFGIPDYAQGPRTRTAILKTYAGAVHGAGRLLADAFHRNALDMGFDTIIHALMHEDNVSREHSRMHGADVFRRYTLFGLTL